jgi:hypothetical protein
MNIPVFGDAPIAVLLLLAIDPQTRQRLPVLGRGGMLTIPGVRRLYCTSVRSVVNSLPEPTLVAPWPATSLTWFILFRAAFKQDVLALSI